MKSRLALRVTVVSAALSVLTACGGGSDSQLDIIQNADRLTELVKAYSGGLATPATTTALASAADLYDADYIDSGETRQNIVDALNRESSGLAAGETTPVFPQATVSGATLSNCDGATSVCTLTSDVKNSDVDNTTVTITTQVRFTGGKFRLFGDQKSASAT